MSAHGVLAQVHGVALVGLEPNDVRVECTRASGLPGLRLVGLPDAAVREAGDRVRTGLQRSGFAWPLERLVVNLAPADLPKAGTSFDLPLAIAVLVATGQVPATAAAGIWACGEVGLDGTVRPVPGILPIAAGARRFGARRLLVPDSAAGEAALVAGLEVVPVRDLGEVASILRGDAIARVAQPATTTTASTVTDLADVRGQAVARRAIELSAAGGHHLLLSGPPGCGKTMLAHRLLSLLPPLTIPAAMEVAAVHSLAGERRPEDPLSLTPPLREPHHSVSLAGLIGGGAGIPRPGELALAHHGVLVLDELLETPRFVLDALRQPLERGEIAIVRARARVTYPAKVLLVAATNPCPCGHLGSQAVACVCRPDRIDRYRSRLSGPLLDRIDLHVQVTPVSRDRLAGPADGESSDVVARRVLEARGLAAERWGAGMLVRDAAVEDLRASCRRSALTGLARALETSGGSARAFDRCLRVARTAADLAGCDMTAVEHVEEAMAYRLPSVTGGAA